MSMRITIFHSGPLFPRTHIFSEPGRCDETQYTLEITTEHCVVTIATPNELLKMMGIDTDA